MSNAVLPVEKIPQCLRDLPQWVCWRYVERDGKKTKVPVCAGSGLNASATDPATWTTFEAAHEAYQRSPHLAGVGFVFTKDAPFAGVDLDRCLDEQNDFLWGQDIVEQLATYTEVSPSGRGVKLFLQAKKPVFARCRRDGFGPAGDGEIEIYDQGRFFVVTGKRLEHLPAEVVERQAELDSLCTRLWPNKSESVSVVIPQRDSQSECLRAMLAMKVVDHNDGSHRLFSACCRAVEHNLSDAEAVACIRTYERVQPFPAAWSDADIVRRLRDAERQCRRGVTTGTERVTPSCKSVGQLISDHPELRKPVIHGLLRQGETANLIAPSKVGKSWLVTDLALSLATGRPWLGTFDTEPGNVLILDNELHVETSSHRIPKVAAARNIPLTEIADTVFVDNLRGRLKDIFSLGSYFQSLRPGFFKIIVLDALYRFLPKDTDENSNGSLTDVYNQLDCYAGLLGCSFVLVHHVSKGNQAGKSITDVGAGAGSQSRATDAHLVLRPHEEDDAVVLDAAVRSWPPVAPCCLRWTFPVWDPDSSLDPTALKPERPRRKPKAESKEKESSEPSWTGERFAAEFVSDEAQSKAAIIDSAIEAGLSERKAEALLRRAEVRGLVHRWPTSDKRTSAYATQPAPTESDPPEVNESKQDAVLDLLETEPNLSNREVSRRCGVSRELVRKLRGEVARP